MHYVGVGPAKNLKTCETLNMLLEAEIENKVNCVRG